MLHAQTLKVLSYQRICNSLLVNLLNAKSHYSLSRVSGCNFRILSFCETRDIYHYPAEPGFILI